MKRLLCLVCLCLAMPSLLSAQESKKEGDKAKRPPKEIAVDFGGGVQLKMVLIPSGEFMMGSKESAEATAAFFNKTYGDTLTADACKGEQPLHRVRITQPFYLGTYHVTRGQFRRFVNETGYKTDAERGDEQGAFGWNPDSRKFRFNKDYSWRNAGYEQTDEHPVVNVDWNDAVAFCQWLSRKEGKTYRLPTEAEWEYACRAGTTTRYSSGDEPEALAKVGNVADAAFRADFPYDNRLLATGALKASDGNVFTSPVGSFRPNAFGLYDMHGNAWQWCSDRYSGNYYAVSPVNNPQGPDRRQAQADVGYNSGDERVLRGGAWDTIAMQARSAARWSSLPVYRGYITGFRVARTL